MRESLAAGTLKKAMHSGLQTLRYSLDGNFFLRRRALRRLADFFHGALLELGVGQGPDSNFFRSLPTVLSYTACDRLEFHETFAKGHSPAGEVVLYEGNVLPFGDASFDSLVSLDCLEHINPAEIASYLSEAHRVLRQGGHLVITAPFAYPEHCEPFDYQRFSSYGLEELLRQAGFAVVKIIGRSSALETVLFLIKHRLFAATFPSFITSRFINSAGAGRAVNFVKLLFLPLACLVYLSLACLICLSAFLRRDVGERSALSLGYVAVGRK
jgi:SAM-dependent methyltransferase